MPAPIRPPTAAPGSPTTPRTKTDLRWIRFVLSPEEAETLWGWSRQDGDGYRKLARQFDDADDEVALEAVLNKTRAALASAEVSARERQAVTGRQAANQRSSDALMKNWLTDPARPHVIVLGNEKGGSGKSTTAMHLAIGLLKAGYAVGTIDLDTRQGTLTHYVRNRERYGEATGQSLAVPDHRRVRIPAHVAAGDARHDERLQLVHRLSQSRHSGNLILNTKQRVAPAHGESFVWIGALATAIEDMRDRDYIVIDTPGNNTFLSRLAHILADTLVTPLNDSFLDIDVLVRMDMDGKTVLGPSIYSRSVMDRWPRRRSLGGEPLN